MPSLKQPAAKAMTPSWNLLQPSLRLLSRHYLGLVYLFVIPGLVYLLGTLLVGEITLNHGSIQLSQRQIIGLGVAAAGLVWSFINLGPSTYYLVKTAGDKSENIGDYYRHGLRYNWRLYGYLVVFGLLFIGGLLLFVVPGLIVLRRYYLVSYYLVDKEMTIKAAMRQSAADSKPVSGAIWGIIGVQVAIVLAVSLLSAVLPIIGLIMAQILSYSIILLAPLRYREITGQPLPITD